MGITLAEFLSLDTQMVESDRLREQAENRGETSSYPSIAPYKTKPGRGSVAHLFLIRISERGHGCKDWVNTSQLHDIYRSEYGSHVNTLIKLAKSGYLESKKGYVVIEVKDEKGILFPKRQLQRFWKLTKKSVDFLEKVNVPVETLLTKARERAEKYLTKRKIEYRLYKSHSDYFVTFEEEAYDGERTPVVFNLLDLALKPQTWRKLYWCTRRPYTDQQETLAEARQWLEENPGLATSAITPIGVIAVSGSIRSSSVTLNGKRVCVVSSKPVHHTDMYICRLLWLNHHLDHLMKVIILGNLMEECPNCHTKKTRNQMFADDWIHCPYCGELIDKMVMDFILHCKKEG